MNYTSIEQSKKLVELGLNPETADMVHVVKRSDCREPWEEAAEDPGNVFTGIKDSVGMCLADYAVPCWSLGALLELIPHTGFDGIELNNYSDTKTAWTAIFHWKAENTPIRIAKTPLDAVYEVVIWLLENNYIKAEKQ